MSDLSNINTVSDLIRENEKPNPTKEILKLIYKLDPADGFSIAKDILENIAGFHQSAIEQYRIEGETQNVGVWAYDLSIIESSLTLLKNVELWPTENPLNKTTTNSHYGNLTF